MNKNECEICKTVIREKYKHFKLWRVLTIIFMVLTVLFATLYFASGEVFTETINNNDVEIINEGNNNDNDVIINN